MRIDTLHYENGDWRLHGSHIEKGEDADIIFIFGDTDALKATHLLERLTARYAKAHIVGASSSGNVLGAEVSTAPVVATAVAFDRAHVALSVIDFEKEDDIAQLAQTLIGRLPTEGLRHIFLLSDGLRLNGSDLIAGINRLAPGVTVTGGMAGDGARFLETLVIADAPPRSQRIAAVGFYGENLTVSSGCYAGWSEFGTQRRITRSEGNILYEIDGEPALDLYKRYLGEYADDLPNSGLRFPLSIKQHPGEPEVIRTLLAIDETEKSITFAGDVPEGYSARLMKPDIDILIGGAGQAAEAVIAANDRPALGLVVSCVGRKIIMNQLIDEELEAVEETLGDNIQLVGFYSYGEIAPFAEDTLRCQLHNQTITLTAFYED